MSKKLKRCKSVSAGPSGLRCIKARWHETFELDVVHGNGMFIWRDDRPFAARRPFLNNPVTVTFKGKDGTGKAFSSLFSSVRASAEGVLKDTEAEARDRCGCPACTADPQDQDTAPTTFGDMTSFPPEPPLTPRDPEHQLRQWWFDQANTEIERTVPKAVEYSATDLTDIGHDLARTWGREVSDEEAAELGVFFYLRGKVARWVGAVAAGQRPSDDTLFDIGVYIRMAQRIRQTGSWPGVDLAKEGD